MYIKGYQVLETLIHNKAIVIFSYDSNKKQRAFKSPHTIKSLPNALKSPSYIPEIP